MPAVNPTSFTAEDCAAARASTNTSLADLDDTSAWHTATSDQFALLTHDNASLAVVRSAARGGSSRIAHAQDTASTGGGASKRDWPSDYARELLDQEELRDAVAAYNSKAESTLHMTIVRCANASEIVWPP